MKSAIHQLNLFDDVLTCYASGDPISNESLYKRICANSGLDAKDLNIRVPIGQAQEMHSPLKRKVRWWQQSLKALGLLEREDRGVWKLTPKGKNKLTPAPTNVALLGFSTDLGIALWSRGETAFPTLDEPISLCLTSLPYPLNRPRNYGNPSQSEYVDWVCNLIAPIIKNLMPGGSIALNVGNDVFLPGGPARSTYQERLIIALEDSYGMFKMDNVIWNNPARPPGPLQWASLSRQQLNGTYESIIWMTNDPKRCRSDNRRVLQPHSEQHLKLVRSGGERRQTSYGDGAHRLYEGSYGRETAGKIPRNILNFTHNCTDKTKLAKLAKEAGLPVHGATMPLSLAQFLIEFLSEPNDLVVDPCAGWFRTAKACEQTGRRWYCTEMHGEYVLGGALGMRDSAGFEVFGRIAA